MRQISKNIIYEDELGIAVIADNPAAIGHVQVFPKRGVDNLNELTDDEASHLFYIASFSASTVFEGLKAEGTNIIMQNGNTSGNEFDRLCINVLPRKFEDGINFKWEPKKFSDEELKETMSRIKDETFYIGKKREEKKPIEHKTHMEKLKAMSDSYLLKQLDRIP